MASITSLSNSSASSSIYGTRNVLSGLASGMDTEAMIENAVSGLKMKISALQQKRTKVEWQQEAYRSIIDKMTNFTQKYTSYASNTNLLSSSFFNSAVKTTTAGTYADKITASGRTSSDVQILGVQQLAKAATYRVSSAALGGNGAGAGGIQGKEVDLAEVLPQSMVSGTMTLSYGGNRTIDLEFDELTTYRNANDLAKGIREKLDEIKVTTSSGEQKKASEMVDVQVKNGNIVFSDKQEAGNSVTVSSATGKIKDTLGINSGDKSSTLTVAGKTLVDDKATRGEYLAGKSMNVTLDGVSKKITLPEFQKDMSGDDYLEEVKKSLEKAFGKGKLEVSNASADKEGRFALSIKPTQEGSTLNVTSAVGEALGLDESGNSNYVDTGKTLGELLGDQFKWNSSDRVAAEGDVRQVTTKTETYYVDSKGNRVASTYDDPEGSYYQVDSEGKFLYDFKVNGVSVGKFNEDSALESVMTAINSNPEAGVKVSYSKVTNEFQFTANETGSAGAVEFEGLSKQIFGNGELEEGKDAVLSMRVNGKLYDGVSRSGNSFEVDGLTINLKGTFGEYDHDETGNAYKLKDVDAAEKDAVSFTSVSDSDKIVDAIKSMVEDYNAMVTEIKNAYSTQPATKSDKSRYEPLTAEQEKEYTESELKAYNEKAKQGILFADSNLSGLYSKLRAAVTPIGTDGQDLREIGIDTAYSNGLTTLSLDETALRNALESDPDKVRNVFTKSTDSGASSNGLMESLLEPLNTYAKTTGEPKGVLINHAGSVKAPTSLNSNSLKSQIDIIDNQIDRWQDKISDQIDRYTTKFSKLEQLIAQMNSQSSALMGLMGGSSY